MRSAVPILAVLLALAGCDGGSESTPQASGRATVRLAAVPGRPAAGYFTLAIEGERGALLSVSSPSAGRIEIHETMQHGGMTGMRPLARVSLRDGERLVFAPGGRHLMIYDLDRTVPAGGRIPLILHFERGDPMTLDAELVPTGGDV